MMSRKMMLMTFILITSFACESDQIKLNEIKTAKSKIQINPMYFFKLPKNLQDEKELILFALEKNTLIYDDLDAKLKDDESFVLDAVERNFDLFHRISNTLKSNSDIQAVYQKKVAQALIKNPSIYERLDMMIYDDLEIAKIAIELNFNHFNLLSERLQSNETLIKIYLAKISDALKQKKVIFRDILPFAKDDVSVALIAIDLDASNEEFISKRLRQDPDVLKLIVEKRQNDLDRLQNLGIEMIFIEGGSFVMGLSKYYANFNPAHQVRLNGFYMSKTEITVRQYRKCVDAHACEEPTENKEQNCHWWRENQENHPMNCVTWHQARQFAKWLNSDLPTEAQWEFAGSSRGKFLYPWGNADPNCLYVNLPNNNILDCRTEGLISVCSKPVGNTQQGLCDMIGNADEWILDRYFDRYEGAPTDGSAWCNRFLRDTKLCDLDRNSEEMVVVRGSGKYDDDVLNLKARRSTTVNDFDEILGFRIVRR